MTPDSERRRDKMPVAEYVDLSEGLPTPRAFRNRPRPGRDGQDESRDRCADRRAGAYQQAPMISLPDSQLAVVMAATSSLATIVTARINLLVRYFQLNRIFMHRRTSMRTALEKVGIVAATSAITVLITVMPSVAQTMPDLKGTWSGPWKSVVYGTSPHHPGHETRAHPPRIRETTFTFEIQGSEGQMFWGQHWSNISKLKEPFAAVIRPDGQTILGSDTDGSLSGTITAPDRIELCYTHSALSPWKSIIAGCGTAQRVR